MIRPAKNADIMALVALIQEMHQRSKYREIDQVDVPMVKKLLLAGIQRHGAQHDGGALVLVSVKDDQPVGFLYGLLTRVYNIGTRLEATDLFFYMGDAADPRDAFKLLDAFDAWVAENPKVVVVRQGATNAIEAYSRMERVLRRRGMDQSGVIYERSIER